MSTLIKAPWPGMVATIKMPSAELNNTRSSGKSVQVLEGTTGDVTTYVKKPNEQRLSMTVLVTRAKEIELTRFFDAYRADKMHVELFDSSKWILNLSGPMQSETVPGVNGAGEMARVTLNFVGREE